MLLPREQSPWNCGYYLGAIALQALEQAHDQKCDLAALQKSMSQLMRRSISPTQVISAAAWLYLIDAVRLNDDGTLTNVAD
jgi:hypothetical protein